MNKFKKIQNLVGNVHKKVHRGLEITSLKGHYLETEWLYKNQDIDSFMLATIKKNR